MSLPPKVEFRAIHAFQDYYADGEGGLYSVARLMDATKDLSVFECPLAAIDLAGEIWRDSDMLGLAFHVKRVLEADLNEPILLDWKGRIADGRHRAIKALAKGKRTIKAKRMTWKPDPCSYEDDE